MAGRVLHVVPPNTFDFSGLASTIGATLRIPLARRIDVSRVRAIALEVRTHSKSMLSNGDQIAVQVVSDAFTEEDPTLDTTSTTPLAQVIVTGAGSVPDYSVALLNPAVGGFLKVVVVGTRAVGASNTIKARISVDLSLKVDGSTPSVTFPSTVLVQGDQVAKATVNTALGARSFAPSSFPGNTFKATYVTQVSSGRQYWVSLWDATNNAQIEELGPFTDNGPTKHQGATLTNLSQTETVYEVRMRLDVQTGTDAAICKMAELTPF